MAKSQSALDQWTTGGFTKHSPPTTHASSVSPPSSLKEGATSSPTKSIDFIEPLSPSPGSVLSIPPYTSPASSFPPSAVHTPAAYEHSNQPFFTFHSPASFSSKSPSVLDASPAGSPAPLMPHLGRGKSSKSGRSYGRHSIQVLRRMSHSAVFPSRAGGLDLRNRSHLEDLNKRYCMFHLLSPLTSGLHRC